MTAGRRRGVRFLLLVIVPTIGLFAAVYFYLLGGRYVETDNAFVKAQTLRVSTDIPGVINQVFVQENQRVRIGQALFSLDDAELRIDMTRALAKIAQVRTDLNSLRAEYREKEAEIALARTRHRFARKVMKRQADLVANSFASASRFDDAQHEVNVTGQQIASLRQSLASIAEQLGGSVDLPAESHPNYQSAKAELEQSKIRLRRATVKATLSGTVSQIPEPGQYLAVGQQALALISDQDLWIEANFTETALTHMRTEQEASVHIDTFPDYHWAGRVQSVSPATGAEYAVIPPQNATGNWVKIPQRIAVRIRLKPTTQTFKRPALIAGMSATVEVDTGHQRELFGLSLASLKAIVGGYGGD